MKEEIMTKLKIEETISEKNLLTSNIYTNITFHRLIL